MPHKRNPITAERVCGLARVVKGQTRRWPSTTWRCGTSATSATPAPSAWRWPTASSRSTTCSGRCSGCSTACRPTPPRWSTTCGAQRGLIFSSKVLLALVDTGISREDAYVIVQRNAMKVWEAYPERRGRPHVPRAPGGRPRRRRAHEGDPRRDLRPPGTSSPARTWCSKGCRAWSSSLIRKGLSMTHYKMRYADRKMDEDAACDVLDAGDFCVVSTVDTDGAPYGVPLSYVRVGDALYLHSAIEAGHKLDNFAHDARVFVTVVRNGGAFFQDTFFFHTLRIGHGGWPHSARDRRQGSAPGAGGPVHEVCAAGQNAR